MGIFGHRGCDVPRDDYVIVRRKHANDNITVAEQLTTTEAKECYDKLKKLYNGNNAIEFTDTNGNLYFIPNHEVGKIAWIKNS